MRPGYDRVTEFTFPAHDPPAVWKSWGLRGGGLPIIEALHGAPITRPRYGFSPDDGLPTLHAFPPAKTPSESPDPVPGGER